MENVLLQLFFLIGGSVVILFLFQCCYRFMVKFMRLNKRSAVMISVLGSVLFLSSWMLNFMSNLFIPID
ncbi:hypothetical protein SY83_16890 [Paenibacillus swuensis]|uniref:Uncharacterized protein n=1 Tax=Paenibacillus swuensis TaxID=1178515 RepID=A0A172TKW9_9BACL|nr:hypothetical protein [Paenibacillus swuensis]ANE47681.1 hypothetical protein SY83_16890 [Paenibacillus swuensis]